ncbi:MAG: hypothetical protein QME47_03795 [Candidatus Thermoplasmatota archaeon]|nr:hypothetical protein [Candidatus Thermoplasmatota archaeon]
MAFEESKIDKYSKITGLPFFFLGIAFLIIIFLLAYQLYTSADTILQDGGEGMEAMMGTYFRISIIIGAKFLALSIMGLSGSWIANKGIMMVKAPKEKGK